MTERENRRERMEVEESADKWAWCVSGSRGRAGAATVAWLGLAGPRKSAGGERAKEGGKWPAGRN
jgi:hypothetical protein